MNFRLSLSCPLKSRILVRQFTTATTTVSGQKMRPTTPSLHEQATMHWYRTIVVGEKLCPFAAPILKDGNLVRVVVSPAQTVHQAICDVRRQIEDLVGENRVDEHETSLIVFSENHSDSFVWKYLDFVRLSWTLQEEAVGDIYREKVQLVLFHPRANHQTYAVVDTDNDEDHPSDYTIRSPYPTIHLLREEDVMKAVQSGYPDLEYLPSRNKAKFTQQGLDLCRERLQSCLQTNR